MGLEAVSPQVSFAIGVGSLLLAMRSSKQKSNLLDTEKPPVLVERGSTIPRIIGVDSFAGMLAWENPTRVVFESFAGGAGGKGIGSAASGDNEVVYAQGQHLIVIGPGARLIRMRQDGRVIWPLRGSGLDGITPAGTPSGTQFVCRNAPDGGGSEGTFRIYWGEIDQPIDPLFADGTAKGLATNDGFFMYVVWDDKRLGGTRRWPVVDYDVEVRPYSPEMLYDINGDGSVISWDPETVAPILSGSSSWITGFKTIDESESHTILSVTNGTQTVVHVCQDQTAVFLTGERAALRNTQADGVFEVVSSVFVPSAIPCATVVLNRVANNLKLLTGVGSTVTGSGSVLADVSMPDLTGYAPTVDDDLYPVIKNRVWVHALPASALTLTFDPDLPGVYTPDGATAANQLGEGTHQMTFYQRKLVGVLHDLMLSFFVLGVEHHVWVRKDAAHDYTLLSTSGDVTFSYTHVDSNYLEVILEFEVPPALVGEIYQQRIIVQNDPTNPAAPPIEFQYLACGPSSATLPFMGHSPDQASLTGNTEVTLAGVPATLNANEGTILPSTLTSKTVAGANFAHVLNEVLTLPRPHGIGDVSAHLDTASLETLGALLETEEMRTHYKVEQGNRHRNILDRAMVELSINCYWDAVDGVWGFRAVRPSASDLTMPEDMLLNHDVDEVGMVRNAAPEEILYKFRNQQRNLTADDVKVNGQGDPENVISATLQKVELDTVRDLEVAEKVASRLYLIESSLPTQRDVVLNRDALSMRVGDFVETNNLFGDEGQLMVIAIKPVPMSQEVGVTFVSSPFVGSSVTTLTSTSGSPPPVEDTAVPSDLAQTVFELSTYASERVRHLALRIPSSAKSAIANTYIARDGLTYQPAGTIQGVTGGEVAGNFATTYNGQDFWGQLKTNPEIIADGPTLFVTDPEFANNIRTLSTVELQRGDQWLVVGKEVMFVRRFQLLGDSMWQAKDVIRGRFEHGVELYLHGRTGYVVQSDKMPILDIGAEAGGAETVKFQVRQNGQEEDLADVIEHTVDAQALAARPPYVGQAAVTSGPGTWNAAASLFLSWPFATRSAFILARQSGIDKQGEDPHPGEFIVEIWDTTETTLVLQVFVSENSVTILGATIESALISAALPADSDIHVKVLSKGYSGLYATPAPAVTILHGVI